MASGSSAWRRGMWLRGRYWCEAGGLATYSRRDIGIEHSEIAAGNPAIHRWLPNAGLRSPDRSRTGEVTVGSAADSPRILDWLAVRSRCPAGQSRCAETFGRTSRQLLVEDQGGEVTAEVRWGESHPDQKTRGQGLYARQPARPHRRKKSVRRIRRRRIALTSSKKASLSVGGQTENRATSPDPGCFGCKSFRHQTRFPPAGGQ